MVEPGGAPATPGFDVRALFPGAAHGIYLDVASAGLISRPVRAAIERYLDARMLGSASKAAMRATVERARARFARLIGGEPDEVAITKNVSEGLNLFASSLPWTAGENVVLCPALEHPNNVWLWYNLKRLRGIEVRALAPHAGRAPLEAMAGAIDEHTRVVTVPHISFVPGFITDVAAVARAAHAHAALVLVDAAQSAGAIRIDVDALGADALVTATQKALHSDYGFGLLWIRRAIADQLVPDHLARYGVDTGGSDETGLEDGDRLRYQPGARRFDLGNYNYLGATAADAAFALIEDIGIDEIEAHVRGLALRLAHGFLELGLPVTGGEPGPDLAHIVCLGTLGDGRHDTLHDPALTTLHQALADHGVRHSARRGVLRFSVGLHNHADDIDRVIALARERLDIPADG